MSTETIIDKDNQGETANCSGHVEPVVMCLSINYWRCKFADYESIFDEDSGEEYRSYRCTNSNNTTGFCDLENKWNGDSVECHLAEKNT